MFSVASMLPRFTLLKSGLFVLALFTLLLPAAAPAQTTYSGGGASFTTSSPSTGVTSTITVNNAPGTVASVEVQLLGVKSTSAEYTTGPDANEASYDSLGYAEFLLVGPSGEQLVLLYQTGSGIDGCDENDNPVPACDGLQGATSGSHPDTITIVDGAHYAPNGAGSLGEQYEGWQTADMPYTVEPSSYSNFDGDFPPPLPVSENTADYPQSDGSATLNGRFGGTTANGTWTLYLVDNDPYPGVDPFSITGWNLILTFAQATPTTTSLSSSANPASYPNSNSSASVTFTATVTSSSGTPTGTVAFQANGSTISGCGAKTLSGSGNTSTATCTTSLAQGGNSIAAQYAPTGSFGQSSSSMTELVEVTAANTTGDTWCNNSPFTDPINGNPGLAYPSVIKIPSTAYPGKTVATVSVELEGVQGTTNGISGQFLLVAPGGANDLDFFDSGFSQPGGETSEVNLTFEDSASAYVPISTPAASGTFLPTDDNEGVNPDSFPASTVQLVDSAIPQVPSKVNFALPYGEDNVDYKPYTNIYTFGEAFNSATANGDWALYSTVGEGANINNGWCLSLTLNSGTSTTTALTSGSNPAATGQPLTFTASVTSGGNPVNSGTVTFLDDSATPAGTVSGNNVITLNGSGMATFTTSSLSEGDHTFTANYSGVTNEYNASFSSVLNQRINTTTTITNVNSNTWQFCDPGAVLGKTTDPAGPLTPNPSVITVANLPGTLDTVTVQLTNFSVPGAENLDQLETLIEGPTPAGDSTGPALDFFSNTTQGASGASTASSGNYIFEDSAGAQVSSGDTNLSPGSYKPTAYEDFLDAADKFTSSTSGFYPAPATFSYASPTSFGSDSTFADVFTNGSNPNGTWNLFFNTGQSSPQSTLGAANGWCVNLTENLPALAQPALAHAGTFIQSEQNAAYTVNITNNGPGATGDPTGTTPLMVVDVLNSAFTYSGFVGTGWTCSASGQTVTCTNDSAVAEGSSYPTLTIYVDVADGATGSINNTVAVSGAGVTAINSNTDSVTIQPAPVLAVSKSHSSTFTQGSTASWNIQVSNNSATSSGATSGATVTVQDSLPTGYTLAGSSGSGWNCNGSSTVTCTSTQTVAGAGGLFPLISLTVNVPAASPTSVTNNVVVFGGGDLFHTNASNGATASDTASVVQVPASIAVSGGGSQSTTVSTAFGTALSVTMEDAASNPVQGVTVTFTAPGSGASGAFSNSSNTITATTNASGIASESFTANSIAGAYIVSAAATGLSAASFSLTNTAGAASSMTAIAGATPQSATVNIGFANPLAVTVEDTYGNPVSGVIVTFTAPASAASGTFSNSSNTIAVSTDASGEANAGTFTANSVAGIYTVGVSLGSLSATFNMTNTPGPFAGFTFISPAQAFTGWPIFVTVTAVDQYNNTVTTFPDTVDVTSSDPAAVLPPDSTLFQGSGTFQATLNTAGTGSQTFTVTDTANSIASTTSPIFVLVAPNLVVTTAADDAAPGDETQCTPQAAPGTGTDAACSLRDALNYSSSFGAANISFDSTMVPTGTTITLINGSLDIPNDTSIASTSLRTVSGGNSSGVFTMQDQNAQGIINGLAITGGSLIDSTPGAQLAGAAIDNDGTLTVENCTISGNSASASDATGEVYGGAIYTDNDLEISNSIVNGNSATAGGLAAGGGIYNSSYMNAANVTVSGNTVSVPTSSGITGGGGIFTGEIDILDSTVSGNTAQGPNDGTGAAYGGGILAVGPTSIAYSTISGNTATALGGGVGGGVYALYDQHAKNTTISNNIADGDAGGFFLAATARLANTILAGNFAPANADFDNQGSLIDRGGNLLSITGINLSQQGNFGGPTQTLLPLPGSPAICAGLVAEIPSGVTTDQRDLPNTNTIYMPSMSCVDSGSVQTNYALAFTTNPPSSVYTGQAFAPAPVVQLTESGAPAAAATSAVMITDSASLLGGSTAANLASSWATFNNLTISAATPSDTLTATLALNATLNITAQSTAFQAVAPVASVLLTPAPGSVLTSSTVTFTWSAGTGVTVYELRLGTTGPGSTDIYNSNDTQLLSAANVTVPAFGQTIYAQLYSKINGVWSFINYTYTEAGAPAAATMISPGNGSTLSGSSVLFNWTQGGAVSEYWLYIGTTGAGSVNLYNKAVTTTSAAISGLPTNGQTIYVRLLSRIDGAWQYNDYTYTAASATAATITSPAEGSVLPGASATFNWSKVATATEYWVYAGTTGPGSTNLYNKSALSTASSATVNNIPTYGETVYVRLLSRINGVWLYNDYTYLGAGTAAKAVMQTPTPSTTLPGSSQTFTWSAGNGVTEYWLYIGTKGVGSADIYNSGTFNTSANVTTLPLTGKTVYVRLLSLMSGVWQYTDYTYTAQ